MDFSDCFFNDYINEILVDYLPNKPIESKPNETNNCSINFCKDHGQMKDLYCTDCRIEICNACKAMYHVNHTIISQSYAEEKSRNVASSILAEKEIAISKVDSAIENAERESNLIDVKSNGVLQALEKLNEMDTSFIIQNIVSLNLKLAQRRNQKDQGGKEKIRRSTILLKTPVSNCQPAKHVQETTTTTKNPVNCILTFGKMGSQHGEFYRPWGNCVSSKGHIIVSDSGNHRIQIFEQNGKFVSTFGSYGQKPGQFSRPVGVAVTPNDHIVVADSQNCRIQVFTLDGTFIRSFGESGDKLGQFGYLWDVTCDSRGHIIAVDPCNCSIQKFTETGILLKALKFPFNSEHSALRGICITPSNQIVVTDYFRNHLLIVEASFQKYKTVKLNLSNKESFCGPQGVVCDKSGNIIIADSKNGKIKAVDMSGKLVNNVIKIDSQPSFDRPNGLCLTPEGGIVAVNFGNNNVKIW